MLRILKIIIILLFIVSCKDRTVIFADLEREFKELFSQEEYERALLVCDKMESIYPENLGIHLYKGVTYSVLNKNEKAEREFTKIIEKNKKSDFYLPSELVQTYTGRGLSRLMLGKFDLAMEDADKCIKYYQDDKKGYLLKLFIYIYSEDYAKALSFVEIIKAQFPNWSSPYYYNAIVYYLQRSYIQAIEECNLIKKNEFDIDKKYLYIRGLSYLSIGEYFLALNDLTYIYDNYPERKWVNYSLAYAHYKSGNIEQAKINYQISLNAKTKTKDNPHQVYDEIQSVTESFKAKKDVQNVFKILSEMVKEN